MTDISANAPSIIRPKLPGMSFPRLKIGASFIAFSGLVGDALKMAYVDPYTSLLRKPQIIPEDDLEGRDPNW